MKAVERWKADMPVEQEMVPKDKYSIFDRKERKYRKGIHSKFTLGYFELCGRAISDEVKEKVYLYANDWTQNYPSGRGYLKESIHQVIRDRKIKGKEMHSCTVCYVYGVICTKHGFGVRLEELRPGDMRMWY